MENILLDKESQYILKMTKLLSAAPNHELSLSDLEMELGLAKQTIKSYFKKLLNYCQEQGLTTFSVESNHFKMTPDTAFNIFKLRHYLIQKSVKFHIMFRIFTDTSTTFTYLHQELGISRSKCSVHIKELNDYLADYDCHINFIQKNPLLGEEHQIRFVFHNLFWGLDLNDIIEKTSSLEAVSSLLLDFVPTLDYSTFLRIKLNFYIFQINTRHGFFLAPEEDVFSTPDSPYVTYDNFFDKIEAIGFLDICPDLETKQRECRYLYFLFCRANLIMLETWKNTDLRVKHLHAPEIDDIIMQFQSKINFNLSVSELNYLHYNLILMNQEASIFKGINRIFDLEEVTNEVHHTEANTYTFINDFILNYRDQNVEFKALIQHFPNLFRHYLILLKNILRQHKQPLKILVETISTPIHREMLISQVRDVSPVPIIISTFNQLNGEQPDAIISNWMPENKYNDVPFFSTSLFFSDWKITNLNHFLNQIADRKNNFSLTNDFVD